MPRSSVKRLSIFFLAALLSGPVRAAEPPQPGTINYIEGQVSVDGQALAEKAVGAVKLTAGQSLATQDGRAEILLTPGIFFRAGNHSEVQMISPDLANTILMIRKGRALVEVADIHPESNVRINENNASAQVLKPGLYDFDADRHAVRVFEGKAAVQGNGQRTIVKSGHELILNLAGKLKARKFDAKAYQQDDFYRWASLRSSYLTEANVDAARRYAGGGWSPDVWAGAGWYWDPFFDSYTFVPGDGIFYSPFGWGFYSPWFVYGAPYFGYFGGYHHFGPGYQPHYWSGFGARGFMGGARGGSFGSGGFHAGGFRSGGGFGGFRGGGGFHGGGGGFHGGGGGFHGGGGGHR